MAPNQILNGANVPNLSIKNVPEAVVEKLRRRAARNHRSMQGELMALVCQAVERPQEDPDGPLRPLRRIRKGTKSAEEIWEAHRARRSAPVSEGPRAVDIIRADRDGR